MGDIDSVNVAVRIRPMTASEQERGCQRAIRLADGGHPQVLIQGKSFTFNYVFDEDDTQTLVYEGCVSGMLKHLLNGFNATILAYGQTGSGKTYTMGTAYNGVLDDTAGVIPRVMDDIFQRIDELKPSNTFNIKCSFMELYQEQLYDLFSSNMREDSVVDIREDKSGIIIPDLTEVTVQSAREVTDQLVRGSAGRAVASTAMNEQSSRSHAIFTLTISTTRNDEKKTVTTSKFHLVDLAGSERCSKSLATGERFKEGVNINKGLLALGNVISALGANVGAGFVSYRDSKLTRLLQDSLGGNSITLMIACVSPADYNVSETLSTLRYADRARQIKNKPIVNMDPHAAEINRLNEIVRKQRLELQTLRGEAITSLSGSLTTSATTALSRAGSDAGAAARVSTIMARNRELKLELDLTKKELQTALTELAESQLSAHIWEAEHEKMRALNGKMLQIMQRLSGELTSVTTAEQRNACCMEQLEQLNSALSNMEADLKSTEEELEKNKKDYGLCGSSISVMNISSSANDSTHEDLQELMQQDSDEYTKKQMKYNLEVRELTRALEIKRELQQRIAGNLASELLNDEHIEQKVKECEQKISELEIEREELLDKLRNVKDQTSAKLAEERRKRVQALEKEIAEFKRVNLQQAKLLKDRNRDRDQIQNLSSEIKAMKESRVKLIRTMRQESDSFRQYKLQREKELLQLKNKDRKLQTELVRKEALHSKQRSVLKRKCEEAMATNKRLKDALERQRAAQTQKQKTAAKGPNVGASKMEQILHWAEREVEVILSVADAELSLEQLKEDRHAISMRIEELKSEQRKVATATAKNADNDDVSHSTVNKELDTLTEEYDERNAQIVELEHRLQVSDLETRIRTFSETLSSPAELRAVILHFLRQMLRLQKDATQRKADQSLVVDELRARITEYEKKLATQVGAMRTSETAYNMLIEDLRAEVAETRDREYAKYVQLKEELEYYKNTDKKSKKRSQPQNKVISLLKTESALLEEETASETEVCEDNDPEWLPSPKNKRRRRDNEINTRIRNNEENISGPQLNGSGTEMRDTLSGTIDSEVMETGDVTQSSTASNTTNFGANIFLAPGGVSCHRCKCRNNCQSHRCGCKVRNSVCSQFCKCSKNCVNKKTDADEELAGNVTGKENLSIAANTTFQVPVTNDASTSAGAAAIAANAANAASTSTASTSRTDDFNKALGSIPQTPRVARTSQINFDTPNSRRKFFE